MVSHQKAPVFNQLEGPSLKDNVLYFYIDESGNLDFSNKGTEWFIVTGVVMRRPFDAATSLLTFKYDCIEEGIEIEAFHASKDVNTVKTGVYTRISEHGSRCKAYSAKVHKPSLPEEVKDPAKVYSIAFDWLVYEAFKDVDLDQIAKVIVVTDTLPKDATCKQVEKPLKTFMKRHFQDAGVPYVLLHRKSESDPNLQVADYMSWAVYRHEAKGLDWPLSKVNDVMESVSEVIVV